MVRIGVGSWLDLDKILICASNFAFIVVAEEVSFVIRTDVCHLHSMRSSFNSTSSMQLHG